jgi:hypothetical protein
MPIILPEIFGLIAQFSGDRIVLWTLRKFIDPALYKDILLKKRRILIFGQVQSGKTAAIIDIVQKPLYTGISKIIIIQNSALVLEQYQQRFIGSGIPVQIINSRTTEITQEVIIIMNNKFRYKRFLDCANKPEKYIVIIDESDSYPKGSHPLAEKSLHEYYVTATPRHKLYKEPGFFHTIKKVQADGTYRGLKNIIIEYSDATISLIIKKFQTEDKQGMMLINCFKTVNQMVSTAVTLSKEFQNIIFVSLNSKRRVIIKGKSYTIKHRTLSKIIDMLKAVPHIVFIANRMSLRGLSYTSSDYSRHLTHQYSDISNDSITSSLQKMRIFGKYTDNKPVKLILPTYNDKRIRFMNRLLDIDFEVSREFTL